MLLFRLGSDRQIGPEFGHEFGRERLLVVLLVGENAVSGLHQRALKQALTFIYRYKLWKPTEPFLILGPYFSGTQPSLSRAIGAWSIATGNRAGKKTYAFSLVSGTATAVDPKGFGEALLPPERAKVEIDFRATMIPEDIVLRQLLRHQELLVENGANSIKYRAKDGY